MRHQPALFLCPASRCRAEPILRFSDQRHPGISPCGAALSTALPQPCSPLLSIAAAVPSNPKLCRCRSVPPGSLLFPCVSCPRAPRQAKPLPISSFQYHSMAGQCLADPWPRAPRRAIPSQCVSLLFLCDAMPINSIASRIEAVQIRLPSPPAESPRPNAEANRGCALPLRRVQFSAMPTQCHAHLPIAIPSHPGGASHRSSRIS